MLSQRQSTDKFWRKARHLTYLFPLRAFRVGLESDRTMID
jgi:hypothetical protein